MNRLLDFFSDYLAHRKGLLPILGIGLVILNFIVRLLWPESWLAQTDLALHLGLLLAIFGFMLAWAL